jgi:menaquinone-dependent protoporphyrinogen oxidase
MKGGKNMKILIAFGSKTGTTENCAKKIKEAMGQVKTDIIDLNHNRHLELSQYDAIIIGTPLYMGRIHGKVKRLLEKNSALLMSKELHFFICGLALGDEGVSLFKKKITNDLYNHAKQVKQLGGEAHLEKLNPFYRLIMKKILKDQNLTLELHNDDIIDFSKRVIS